MIPENLPSTEFSDTIPKSSNDKISSPSLTPGPEAQTETTTDKTPAQSEIEVKLEKEAQEVKPSTPSFKSDEMVEIPLNDKEPEVKLEKGKGKELEDLEVISSIPTENIKEKLDIHKKRSSPAAVGLRETSSRGSIKNRDRDKSLTGNNSEMKKRKKNKKLSARIRSFWLSTFGKAKSPVKKQDAS